jgi:hypothetical protein
MKGLRKTQKRAFERLVLPVWMIDVCTPWRVGDYHGRGRK